MTSSDGLGTSRTTASENNAQIAYWNEEGGQVWTRMQERMDRQLAPLGEAMLDAAALLPGEHVLDVGCGCGHTTLLAATQVSASGRATGVDVSEPMLTHARARASETGSSARFILGDAQVADAAVIDAPVDVVISRFGVMFFADPVAAFANLASLTRTGGRLSFVCWQSPMQNRWASDLGRELAKIFPIQPPVDPHAPGPFAFADPERTAGIVTAGGWKHVEVEACTRSMQLFGASDRESAIEGALTIGPASRLLRDATDEQRLEARAAAERVIDAAWTEKGAIMDGVCWIVTARR